MKTGPIIIIEDDQDDKSILEEVLEELGAANELRWFNTGMDAIAYLQHTAEKPFIIFSDINLPGLNGIALKKRMDADPVLRKKCIPFVFYSTAANQETVDEAYLELAVQGFFIKPTDFEKITKIVKLILDYWCECVHPNT